MIDKQDVYYQLCDQINKLGFGFDHTPEQHELSLFKRFYTPEEAQWSLEMPLDCFFTAADFAEKTGRTVQEAQRICEGMAMQGQILSRDSRPYCLLPRAAHDRRHLGSPHQAHAGRHRRRPQGLDR